MTEPLSPDLISAAQLERIMRHNAIPSDTTRRLVTRYIAPINITLHRYDIATPARIAAFLAQVGHESGRLRHAREIWGPTSAQRRYEGRQDLGNTQRGDGKRFMGRGLIQITGRSNYAAVSAGLDLDFVASPETLETPMYAALSAGWYWDSRSLNELAEVGNFKGITRAINGGTNGLKDRIAMLETALQVIA